MDGWPEIYTKWGENEPDMGKECVVMAEDSTWRTEDCNESFGFLAKQTEGTYRCFHVGIQLIVVIIIF